MWIKVFISAVSSVKKFRIYAVGLLPKEIWSFLQPTKDDHL